VDLLWIVTFGNGNIESYGGNQIIVLIVHIVTLFLNEAMPFSLFNAMQILCIPIGETQGKKPTVVFIVLIVLIVTQCLNEALSFSLINVVHILCFPIWKIQAENLAVVFIVLIVLIGTRCLNESNVLFFV
jgi:hypothetical protein